VLLRVPTAPYSPQSGTMSMMLHVFFVFAPKADCCFIVFNKDPQEKRERQDIGIVVRVLFEKLSFEMSIADCEFHFCLWLHFVFMAQAVGLACCEGGRWQGMQRRVE